MTSDESLGRVLALVEQALDTPSAWGAPVEMRDSLALCALNSAHTLRASSASVRNVLRRYRAHRAAAGADPEVDSGPDLLRVMDAAGGPRLFALDVLETRATFPRTGRLRSEAIYDALEALAALGVSTAEELRDAADDRAAERAWRSVKGLGPQSWAYLLMNAGDPSRTKPDTMVQRFLERAVGRPVRAAEATQLVTAAASTLGVEVRALDRAIWLFETPDKTSKKKAGNR